MKRSAATPVAEEKGFAEDLDRRVVERTAELTATIEQLRRELAGRNQAEQAPNERDLFNLIVESIPAPVAVTSPTGEVEALNKPTLEYFGRTFEELKGWKSSDVVHPDDLERTVAAQIEAHQTGLPYNVESRHRRADGVYRWFNVLGLPLRDAQGNILHWFHLQIDIDDRKQAEEALRSAERNLNLTINTIPTLIQVSRPDGSVMSVNQAVLDYYGVTLEDMQKEDFRTRVYHPDDVKRVSEYRKEALNRPVQFEYEQRALNIDGTYRWFLVRYNPLINDRGEIDRWYATAFDIEDRKRAEFEREQSQEALRNALADIQKSESKLRQVIDAIPALAWCNLPDGPNEFLSKGWHEYTGLSPEESHGWGWQAAFHPEDLPPLMERWLKMLASGEPDEIEARLRRHDGVYRWFLIRAEPFCDESGEILRWYGTSTDIDDRKRAEALLAGEKRLLEMVASGSSLPDVLDALCRFVEDMAGPCYCGVYLIDPSGTKFHNAAAPSLSASFNDPIEGAPVDRETGPCGMAACLKTQVIASDIASDPRWPASVFCSLALPHGLKSCWSTPILSLAGDVLGTFAIYQDEPASPTPLQQELIGQFTHIASIAIERALSEAALKQSETFLAEAQRLSRIGSFSWRVATNEITWSEQLYRIYDFEPGVPVTFDLIRTRVHPEDLTLYEKMVEQARNGAEDFEWQYRLLMPDQSIKYMHAVARATRNDKGQLEYLAAVQDITRRKIREEKLRRSEAFLAEGQHLARMGNFWWRVMTDQIVWSEPMYSIFEFEPGTTVTLDMIASRVHPDDISSLHDMIERAHRGDDFEYEHRIVMPDGSVKYLHLIAHHTRGNHRGPEYIGAVQDVTQRHMSEEALSKARSELAHVSRVMSLGALTASIAHEVNQPLSGIITNASTCMRMLDAEPPNVDGARETTKRTIRDGRRAADVITRLRALFARKDTVGELVDLNEATREVIALSRSELERNRVITKTELAEQLPPITGDRVQLQQVIMNLLRNGSDAMTGIDDRPRELLFRTEIEDGDRIRLSVQDAGSGFHGQSLDQLFQSFYTTKQNGMGIGLSVSRSIIENHHGRLSATPNDGPGVTFSFSIPFAGLTQ